MKENDWNFEQCQLNFLNFKIEPEDKTTLDSEDAVLVEDINHISDVIQWLEQLENLIGTTEPVIHDASGMGDDWPWVRSITEVEHFSWRLNQELDSLVKV